MTRLEEIKARVEAKDSERARADRKGDIDPGPAMDFYRNARGDIPWLLSYVSMLEREVQDLRRHIDVPLPHIRRLTDREDRL